MSEENTPSSSRSSIAIYLWSGAMVAALALLGYVIALYFFMGKEARMEQAILAGQHKEISIETGEVVDGPLAKQEEKEEKEGKEEKREAPVAKGAAPPPSVPLPLVAEQEAGTAPPPTETAPTPPKEEEETYGPHMSEMGLAPPANVVIASASTPEAVRGVLMGTEQQGPLREGEVWKEAPKPETDKLFRPKPDIKVEASKNYIGIVILGMGLSVATTEEALELPPAITIGLTPYSTQLENWIKRAHAAGHEVALHVPMETRNFLQNDPGPYALLAAASAEDNKSRLDTILLLSRGYDAIYTGMDETFTQTLSLVKPMLTTLNKRNIPLVYGGGHSNLTFLQYAESINSSVAAVDMELDSVITAKDIKDKLDKLEKLARRNGYAVAYAHAYPLTRKVLTGWAAEVAKQEDLVLAPISAVFKAKETQKRKREEKDKAIKQ